MCLSGICLFVQKFFTKKVAEKFGWYSLIVVILHPQSRNNVRVAEGCESFFEKITESNKGKCMVFLSVVIILYVYISVVCQFKRVRKRRPSAVKRQNKEVCGFILEV